MNYIHQYHTEPQIIHNRKIDFVPHLHDEIEIISVFGGSATLTADGYSYNVSKGDFIILFPNIIHSYSHEKNVDVGKFIFSADTIPELTSTFNDKRPKTPVITPCTAEGAHLSMLAEEILSEFKTSSDAVKKAYLLLLTGKLLKLCTFEESRDCGDTIVLKIFDYCKNNYTHDITLDEVANALYVSKSYVSHIFCCKLKINFRNYINTLRVNKAASLLRHSNISATEAAEQSGFGSIRTFNRAFVKYMGVTPREYKVNIRR